MTARAVSAGKLPPGWKPGQPIPTAVAVKVQRQRQRPTVPDAAWEAWDDFCQATRAEGRAATTAYLAEHPDEAVPMVRTARGLRRPTKAELKELEER